MFGKKHEPQQVLPALVPKSEEPRPNRAWQDWRLLWRAEFYGLTADECTFWEKELRENPRRCFHGLDEPELIRAIEYLSEHRPTKGHPKLSHLRVVLGQLRHKYNTSTQDERHDKYLVEMKQKIDQLSAQSHDWTNMNNQVWCLICEPKNVEDCKALEVHAQSVFPDFKRPVTTLIQDLTERLMKGTHVGTT